GSGSRRGRRGTGRWGRTRATPAWSRPPATGRTPWSACLDGADEARGALPQAGYLLLPVLSEQRRVPRTQAEGRRCPTPVRRAPQGSADRGSDGVAPSAGVAAERRHEARRTDAVDDVLAPRAQQLLRGRASGTAQQHGRDLAVQLEAHVVQGRALGVLPAQQVQALEVDAVEVGQQGTLRVPLAGVDEGAADQGFGQRDHGGPHGGRAAPARPGWCAARGRAMAVTACAGTPGHAEQAVWAAPLPAGVMLMPCSSPVADPNTLRRCGRIR